jgi:hypothetical protein
MEIEKDYFPLPEIIKRWSIQEDDLVYLAENNQLRLSIRVFNLPLEFGDYEEDVDGARFRVPEEQRYFSGLLDLHASDVFQLYRTGEAHLNEFRHARTGYACLMYDHAPIYVVIGDLLLRRDERDCFELQSGFRAAGATQEEPTFLVSRDYKEVRCSGHLFQLGAIQATVVRALHEAALAGQPWQSGKRILSAANSKSMRMADVFKSKETWRELIKSDGRGNYRLNID